jgi:hypothetical protein
MTDSLKIAQIWYNEEHDLKKNKEINIARPLWEVLLIHEERLNLFSAQNLIDFKFDAILTHLSHPYAMGLRLAELAHVGKSNTKIILLSNTKVPDFKLYKLFDGLIRFDVEQNEFCAALEELISRQKIFLDEKQCEKNITEIIKYSGSIQDNFRRLFKDRHKEKFTIKDYYLLIGASTELAYKNFLRKNDLENILEFLSKDKVKEVFSIIHEVKRFGRNLELFQEITLLENRFHRNERGYHEGIIKFEDYNIEKNQIIKALGWSAEKFYNDQNQY